MDASYVARIVEKISESQYRLRSNDSGEQSTVQTYQISEDECKIEMPEKLYTDKKGNLFGAMNQKVVSTQFCNDTVLKYKDFLDELLNNGIETLNLVGATTSNIAIYPVVSLTPELHDNCMRTGQPPVEPSYSSVSMWRNEIRASSSYFNTNYC